MVDEESITLLSMCSIGVFLNGTGLYLLLSLKNCRMDTQRVIIINLCVFDCCLNVVLTIETSLQLCEVVPQNVDEILHGFKHIVNIGFYYATFWLIFDRYLHIKLNIKYQVFWSRKKTKIAMVILWSLAVLSGSLIQVYIIDLDVLVYASIDSIILIFSIFVYTYSIILIKRQRKKFGFNQHRRKVYKGLLLSVIIITTFAVLVAVPDTVYAIERYVTINSDTLAKFLYFSYLISLWSDALIYILLSPKVRLALKRKFFSFKNSFIIKRSET